jgi:cell division protein FtsB
MTTRVPQSPDRDHGADPWWTSDEPTAAVAAPPGRTPAGRSRRPAAARSRRSSIGWLLLGLLVAPIDWFRGRLARSPRLRRIMVRLTVFTAICAVLVSSVGVILINNVVIGRTAELGELEDRRRELRRDNALLGAQAARLEAPDVVFRRAANELGMVRPDSVPAFMYLVPGSRTITPAQRRRIVERARVRREQAAARATARAAAADAPSGSPAAAAAAPAAAAPRPGADG